MKSLLAHACRKRTAAQSLDVIETLERITALPFHPADRLRIPDPPKDQIAEIEGATR